MPFPRVAADTGHWRYAEMGHATPTPGNNSNQSQGNVVGTVTLADTIRQNKRGWSGSSFVSGLPHTCSIYTIGILGSRTVKGEPGAQAAQAQFAIFTFAFTQSGGQINTHSPPKGQGNNVKAEGLGFRVHLHFQLCGVLGDLQHVN